MESAIVAESDRQLTFNGNRSVTIPPGSEMLSDTVTLDVKPLGELAVSIYVPGETGAATVHSMGLHTVWISKEGDFTGAPALADAAVSQSWYWVSAVDVLAA